MSADIWPTLFIPHGGGPCFFMEPPRSQPRDTWDRMGEFLRGLDRSLARRPRAVVVVSGHWEAEQPTLNVARQPKLLFDYYGFPPHTYLLTYPVAGAPALAGEIRDLLAHAGIASTTDGDRGLDHGVFVPFKLIYPEADVPVLQLSLKAGLDPAEHVAIGRALRPLRDSDVLIVGSGMSYHNLGDLFCGCGGAEAEEFDTWLTAAVTNPTGREDALIRWREAPSALQAHPQAEHLLPLMVAAGAAGGEAATRIYADHVLGKPVSGYRFG